MLAGFLPADAADVKGPCEEELQTYCSEVRAGEGRISQCLDRYAERLSAECREYREKSAKALKQFQDACAGDAQDYCRDVKTSFRRIVHCLKERINEVSPGCREVLKKPK
jgi:hypothetical protein